MKLPEQTSLNEALWVELDVLSGHVPSRVRVASLIDRGADPNACLDGVCALSMAAGEGLVDIVELLLPLADQGRNYSTALSAAARHGFAEVVGLMLSVCDARANDSMALSVAAGAGQAEVVRLLMPKSDAWARNSMGLRLAASRGRAEIVDLLWQGYAGREAEFLKVLRETRFDPEPYEARMEQSAIGEALALEEPGKTAKPCRRI